MGQGPVDGEAGWSRWPLAQALGWNGQRRRAAGDRLEMTVLSVNGQRGGVPGARTREAEGALEVSGGVELGGARGNTRSGTRHWSSSSGSIPPGSR